jgi:hypothetical protein
LPNWVANARTIIDNDDGISDETNRFHRELAGFEDAWRALTWLLARSPEKLSVLSKIINGVTYHLYTQGSDEWAQSPSITILYSFDDQFVTLYGITAEPYKENNE